MPIQLRSCIKIRLLTVLVMGYTASAGTADNLRLPLELISTPVPTKTPMARATEDPDRPFNPDAGAGALLKFVIDSVRLGLSLSK
jgi:hypothetical protein